MYYGENGKNKKKFRIILNLGEIPESTDSYSFPFYKPVDVFHDI